MSDLYHPFGSDQVASPLTACLRDGIQQYVIMYECAFRKEETLMGASTKVDAITVRKFQEDEVE